MTARTGTGVSAAAHLRERRGTYNVTLTVTDNRGDTGSVTHTVSVTDSPATSARRSIRVRHLRTHGRERVRHGRCRRCTWSLVGTASSFSVGGGVGRIAGAVSTSRAAYLSAVRQTDIDLESDVALDQAASGGGVYVSFIGRRTSNGNDYLFKLRYQAGGSVVAYLVRVVGGTETVLSSMTVPGLTVSPGDQLRVRFQVERNDDDVAAREGVEIRHGRAGQLAADHDGRDSGRVARRGRPRGARLRVGLVDRDVAGNIARQPRRRRARLTKPERHEPGATAAGG